MNTTKEIVESLARAYLMNAHHMADVVLLAFVCFLLFKVASVLRGGRL